MAASAACIGKLKRVPLREVWKHEAYDFTQWLEENIDVLNSALDMTLVSIAREQAAGPFSIDLVAEEENGGTVIIENQLERSNHDHLGKLITYLTGMSAKTAIWIVSDPRPEHVAAVAWLNESTSATFYMVKVEAVRIGDSSAAPLFTLIVGPSEESKSVGGAKRDIAERHTLCKLWWRQLIERSAKVSRLHAHLVAPESCWLMANSGIRGIGFNYVTAQNFRAAELYIDRGRGMEGENEAIFDRLFAKKDQIEESFGGKLQWNRLNGKRACTVRTQHLEGGYRAPEEQWPVLQDQVIAAMRRFEEAIRPYLPGPADRVSG